MRAMEGSFSHDVSYLRRSHPSAAPPPKSSPHSHRWAPSALYDDSLSPSPINETVVQHVNFAQLGIHSSQLHRRFRRSTASLSSRWREGKGREGCGREGLP